MEVEAGSLVICYTVSLTETWATTDPCLKNKRTKKTPIDSSWPKVPLAMENLTQTVSTAWLPALVGIYLLRNSGPHPSHKLSSHIMCEVFRRWPVATCLRLRERPGGSGSCQSLISEGLQVPPLLRRTGSTLATSLEGPLLMPQKVSYAFSPGLRAPGPSS